jgi:hypothetical protein
LTIIEEYNIYNPQDDDQDFPLLQEVSDSESETEPVRKESSEGEFPILVESHDSEESDGDDEDIITLEFNELFSAMKAGEVTKPPAAKHPITICRRIPLCIPSLMLENTTITQKRM